MDRILKKRPSAPATASDPSLPKLDTRISSPATSSPASSIESSKGDFFQAMVPRAIRSLSRGSNTQSPRSAGHAPSSPQPRRLLSKSHSRASTIDLTSRRGSVTSEEHGRISRASTTVSGSSTASIDWRSQAVESHAALEPDTQFLRNKTGYLVITTDFIVVLKSKTDFLAAFPQQGVEAPRNSYPPMPEPLQVIPIHELVAVFYAESPRPSFGMELWWRSPFPSISFRTAQFFFSLPKERQEQMDCIHRQIRTKGRDPPDVSRVSMEVEERIKKIIISEEPEHPNCHPEIFPVAYRTTPSKDGSSIKSDDRSKKGPDGPSYYFAIGVNLCFLIEISKGSLLQEGAPEIKYERYGLVTLETFQGHWFPHEERFVMRFRDPFKPVIVLELASRYYKQIILTLMKADRYLRPAWPPVWQTLETFQVVHMKNPQQPVAGEDYGGFQRTLAAYMAAYKCGPVEWEINWKAAIAPEFRLLPSRTGGHYSALQLLAVLRALRYNDYFTALSFRDVDLSELWGRHEVVRRGNIAYMDRNCLSLTEDERWEVQRGSVLHQEFHALAFGTKVIRQIDFTNSLRSYPADRDIAGNTEQGVQFLTPILNLLETGLTRCNRLILSGCALSREDVIRIVDALTPTIIDDGPELVATRPGINLEVLNVSNCGLSDQSLRNLLETLPYTGATLQDLDISGNLGRVNAFLISEFMECAYDLRSLNVSGSLMGTIEGPLVSFEALVRLIYLEELNLSHFKMNEESISALERYLLHLAAEGAAWSGPHDTPALSSLILNDCRISGYDAGRLFSAMTGLYNVHLCLNENPLEDGIDHLARSIGLCWKGQFGLHMDMVEFREDASYIQLIKALAMNKHIRFLSLAGTAPTPKPDGTCSAETCEALAQLFERNESIRYLDISGFSGKLDEGQLGKGFSRCLRGLAANKTITHLRLRNQNLNDDIGILGWVITQNSALLSLDCEDNNFNLTSMRYLVESLRQNDSIVDFPFGADEQQQLLRRCIKDVSSSSNGGSASASSSVSSAGGFRPFGLEEQKALFKSEIRRGVLELRGHLERNRAAAEARSGCFLNHDESRETGPSRGWPALLLEAPASATPTDAAEARASAAAPRKTVRSASVVGLGTIAEALYRVEHTDEALHSPSSETASPGPASHAPSESGSGSGSGSASRSPPTPELEHQLDSPKSSLLAEDAVVQEGGAGPPIIDMPTSALDRLWSQFKLTPSSSAAAAEQTV